MKTTKTPRSMPAELANLKRPTRQDAATLLRVRRGLGAADPASFEATVRGRQCRDGVYSLDKCAEYRADFEKQYDAAIADALSTLEREYERKLTRRQQLDAADAAALDAEVDRLRERYLSQPGATEAGFAAAKEELLEAARRRATLDGPSEDERALARMRASAGI